MDCPQFADHLKLSYTISWGLADGKHNICLALTWTGDAQGSDKYRGFAYIFEGYWVRYRNGRYASWVAPRMQTDGVTLAELDLNEPCD
jgi:hypothetical protein